MKEKLFIVDDNLQHIFNKVNMPVGGASVQSYSWFNGFKKYYDVKVLSRLHEKSVANNENIINYSWNASKAFSLLFKMMAIHKILRKEKPAVVFVSVAGLNAFIFGVLCKINKVTYVQRISNDISFDPKVYKKKLGRIKYNLAVFGVKRANIVLCQNKTQSSNLAKFVHSSKIHIVYNPFIVEHKLQVENTERDYVAWLGLFQYQKNMPLLLEIASELREIKFKVAGEPIDRIDQESLDALSQLKKMDNVEFVGLLDRENVFTFLRDAKCLLNTSRYEGFSNTFLEAFSTNTPVVTTANIDPDDIIESNNLGFVAKENKHLVSCVKKVFFNFDQEKTIASKYMEQNHSPDVLAKRVKLLINKEEDVK